VFGGSDSSESNALHNKERGGGEKSPYHFHSTRSEVTAAEKGVWEKRSEGVYKSNAVGAVGWGVRLVNSKLHSERAFLPGVRGGAKKRGGGKRGELRSLEGIPPESVGEYWEENSQLRLIPSIAGQGH